MPDSSKEAAALDSVRVLADLAVTQGQVVTAYLEEAGPAGLPRLAKAVPEGAIAPLLVTMTPGLAAALQLAMHPDNRKPTLRTVEQHRRSAADGNWQLTGEGPKVDEHGVTVDGGHRLAGWAMAAAEGAPAPRTMLFIGVPQAAVQEMDAGRKRSLYAQAKIAGWHHPGGSLLLSAAQRLWQLTEHGWWLQSGGSNKIATVAEVRQFMAGHPDLGELARHAKAGTPGGMNPVPWLMVRWLTAQASPQASAEFAEQWATGAGLRAGNPLLALRNRAVRRSGREFHADTSDEQLYLGLRAWSAWCQGRSMEKMTLPRGGVTNEILARTKIAAPSSDRWRS